MSETPKTSKTVIAVGILRLRSCLRFVQATAPLRMTGLEVDWISG